MLKCRVPKKAKHKTKDSCENCGKPLIKTSHKRITKLCHDCSIVNNITSWRLDKY